LTKLAAVLPVLEQRSDYTFRNGNLEHFGKQRRRTGAKLNNPNTNRITFKTLRNYKGTMEYHRTRDILRVKQLLGHKRIENTVLYTQLISFESDEYASAVAKNLEEARKLVEAGFEYVTDIEGVNLFRKRKVAGDRSNKRKSEGIEL